ncbi:hypothetical protein VTJ04DRAFT_10697 [Mycothermus thermophilus]|uniref:uncharacterized protein n=1 Tax=Humicola insolens TaxID=85995 RepID=UPI0037421B13
MSSSSSATSAQRALLQQTTAYIDQLPIFTRVAAVLMVVCEVISLLPGWDIKAWGRLEVDNFSMRRTNTYPFIHMDVFHLVVNLIGVIPLLERFERSYGTIPTVGLFIGPLSTVPAVLYVGIERYILRLNTWVVGASVWGFLILGIEALKRNRASPYLVIYGQRTIPTWTAPLAMVVIAALFMPGSSMLGHLCGLAVGYVFGMGYLNRLIPPDGVCRWIETKLKLKARVPYYVSIDQKAFGRGGVLPGTNSGVPLSTLSPPPTPASPAA